MEIEGSCYCRQTKYSAFSHTPTPYMRCYCGYCRKTSGGGGYAINIMAQADSLVISGQDNLAYHHGQEHDLKSDRLIDSQGKRYFCQHCGSPMWSADSRWPEWIYPFASAVDTSLPSPPEIVHIMLEFAPPWLDIPSGSNHRHFQRYPDESIWQWHQRWNLLQ